MCVWVGGCMFYLFALVVATQIHFIRTPLSPLLFSDLPNTALNLPRYKYLVQVVIGEQKGSGVRMGSRCFWDDQTDSVASETFLNVCVCVGVGVGVGVGVSVCVRD
jgi:hypothetical protein